MIAQTVQQRERCIALYQQAWSALRDLSEERLSLDTETRDALNRTRGSLEEFDACRMAQPVNRKAVAF